MKITLDLHLKYEQKLAQEQPWPTLEAGTVLVRVPGKWGGIKITDPRDISQSAQPDPQVPGGSRERQLPGPREAALHLRPELCRQTLRIPTHSPPKRQELGNAPNHSTLARRENKLTKGTCLRGLF